MVDTSTFVGGAYRTSARFGDRIELKIEGQNVTVTGPRIGKRIYSLWIWLMTLLIAAVPVFLIVSLITLNWAYIAVTAGVFVGHYLVAAGGAGAFWSMASFVGAVSGKYPSASFPVSSVKRVDVGRGWGRGGLRWIIPQFAPLIDRGSVGHCLSFEAPEGQEGKGVVYTICLPKVEDVRMLREMLEGKSF